MNEDFFTDNSNDSGAKYYAKIRLQEVVQNEEELKAKKAEEQRVYNEAYKEFEKLILEMEEHAKAEQPKVEKTFFDKFFEMFGFLLNVGEAQGFERQAKNILFKRKEEQERMFSILEFLKSLIKKILSLESGLSWQERLAKEIADLEKKLDDGTISKEQLQRLELLKCIEFLRPVNLLSVLVKIVSVAMMFELGFTISEKIAKTVENALSTPKEREIKAEMTDNLLANLLNDIFKAPEVMKDLGRKLNEAVSNGIPANSKPGTEKGAKEPNRRPSFILTTKETENSLPKSQEEKKVERQGEKANPQKQGAERAGLLGEQGFESNEQLRLSSNLAEETAQQSDSEDARAQLFNSQENEQNISSSFNVNNVERAKNGESIGR